MIEVEHLSKSYGPIKAVDDISFSVKKGEIVGFLGPNGAGKSTTLRILAGFLGQSQGRVRIAGHDISEEPLEARACLGYMPEASPLYPEMRVSEYLSYRAELKRIPRRGRKEAIGRALADAHIEDVEGMLIAHLSKGYRQRVGLADALLGSPPLLILDEPTAGLDPNQIREVRALIHRLAKEHTVLLSTHILPEVESTCSRAIVIARGRLVAEGSIDEIRAMRRASGVRVSARGNKKRALEIARKLEGVARAEAERVGEDLLSLSITFCDDAESGAVTEALVSGLVHEGIGVRELNPQGKSLESVFAELTAVEAENDERGGGS